MSETYSVVIPAYNAETTIEACLVSVIMQTLAPLEVLVIDDQSRDGTGVVAQQCGERLEGAGIRFQYICLPQNAGPSVARNLGIQMAKGNYIAFLDADDIWHLDKLAVVDQIAAKTNAGFFCHAYTDKLAFESSIKAECYKARKLSIYQMLARNPGQTSCVVIRRPQTLAFDETMRHCEDYDFWMRIVEGSFAMKLVGPPLTRLGRPQLSTGGLSGSTFRMRVGEARVYYNYCQRAWKTRAWYLPSLLVFSLLKHVFSRIRRWIR
jgi:teichuronic acid biosynthesis glycosyltransferase TuaG